MGAIYCAHKAKQARLDGNTKEEKRYTTLKNQWIKGNCIGSGIVGSLGVIGGAGLGTYGYLVAPDD